MKQRATPGRRSIPGLVGIVVTAASAMIGAGLARGGVGPVASPASTDSSATSPVAHVIDIRDLRFEPHTRAVAKGDTIVWVNHDLVPHTVAGADSSWSSGYLAPGEAWRKIVENEGEISYFCEYHPTMRGQLQVK